MPYHQNSAGHGGRRCETARKTNITIHGHHQEGHQKECADGRQHSRPQELEIGSVQGDPLTWKSLQGEKVRSVGLPSNRSPTNLVASPIDLV